jgi:2-polyprenyl-3-methyl-5-hydroxy-6-metoxy-1,4-benzoquinol methylase
VEHSDLIHRDVCPVCENGQRHHYLTCKDYTVSGENFKIVACNSCGFLYTDPVPSPAHIGSYYQSEDYISHSDTKKGMVSRLYHAVRRRSLRAKLKLIGGLTSGRKVLDFGCGTGAFLRECNRAGWNTFGMEPDAGARNRVGGGMPVFSSFEDLRARLGEKVDVITLWHVLEHLYNPGEFLQWARGTLAAGGSLVIAVPNYRSMDAQHYGKFWAAYDVPRHLSHFSRASMEALLRRQGFGLERVIPMTYDSYYVSLLSEKYRTGSVSYLRAFLTGFRSNLSARRSGEYSSLIYICRVL